MKSVFAAVLSLFTVVATAQTNVGSEISPLVQNGKPKFGVTYGTGHLGVMFSTLTTELTPGPAAKVYAKFIDAQAGQAYSDLIWRKISHKVRPLAQRMS